MDLKLQNQITIVTGGAKGIGFGISVALAQEGAIPVIIGRNPLDCEMAVAHIKNMGGEASYVVGELTDPEKCKKSVQETVKRWGRIDGLVNNAGVNDTVGLENGNYKKFMDSLHNNLVHYYLMAHHALPYLKKTGGAIINIGSKTAITGQGGTSGYAASNGGRNALTREWAVELLPYGIRVNAVIVAECMTPLYEKWIAGFKDPQRKLRTITQKIPLGKRMTTVEEIASTVLFLLSKRSGHTTGQLLFVDGGYSHLDRAIT